VSTRAKDKVHRLIISINRAVRHAISIRTVRPKHRLVDSALLLLVSFLLLNNQAEKVIPKSYNTFTRKDTKNISLNMSELSWRFPAKSRQVISEKSLYAGKR